VKFRRKSAAAPTEAEASVDTPEAERPAGLGPFDADDLPAPAGEGDERVDLGSLLIAPVEGRELRLQVDEASGAVQAVLLAAPEGAVELRAFAAPRNGDLWSEVRPQLAADMSRRGGTATEREGEFGTELVCQLQVRRPDGTAATQPSVIVGVNGERWLLRATVMGRPAMESSLPAEWVDTIRSVAVRRGVGAMPVGEPLPLVMPANARRVEPAAPSQPAQPSS
jgi:gas vesicle protein